jgi:hypothetical protein
MQITIARKYLSNFKLDARYAGRYPRAPACISLKTVASGSLIENAFLGLRTKMAFSAPLVISLADDGLHGLQRVDSIACPQ